MPKEAKTTTDREEIRRWVEDRGGKPSTIRATRRKDEPGILRIRFPEDAEGDRLDDVSWEDFFRKFEEKSLAFMFDDHEDSRYCKLINRNTQDARTTVDHGEIRGWVEAHRGHPSTVSATKRDEQPGILRIDFPGYRREDALEPITWDDFFRKFEEKRLAFLYQDKEPDGEETFFCKLISREQHR